MWPERPGQPPGGFAHAHGAKLRANPLVWVDSRIPLSDRCGLSLVRARGRALHSEVTHRHTHLEAERRDSLARHLEGFAQRGAAKIPQPR
jgi:hypothetical protein